MNQVNQENNNGAPLNMPVKRKRGRPRKDQSLPRWETAPMPPGFGVVNGNQPRQVLAIEDASASFVGQPVTGVVEAVFDAGYLLAVKIGNSNTSLRGVVFKPGHYVPISSENDVAPHVQMIRRNEIPFPRKNQTRGRGRRPRSKDRNGQHGSLCRIETGQLVNGLPATNLVHGLVPQTADLAVSKAYPVPYVGSRGTVVPVVLQPVTMMNGFAPANQMPPILSHAGHMVVSNHKPLQIITSQVGPSQPQTSHQVTPEGVKSDPTQDVNKRVQVTSQSSETQIENSMGGGKLSVEDSVNSMEGDSDDTSEPLSVEPLQTIHTNIHNQSGPFTNPSANNRIGRMSELLQALQENMTERRASS
ncbi:protein METABOLIC NETWORK MODULATOR 1-like isoform X1 [Actinidia eriantha]|uniref:protein METABOLIC NETWORK MODULATOR 1-like isoform X1 n=2 Tax=Actinidia eriantha TaxID=165200 RepID=UPI0025868556|nr:protein METABOLIC NETWORK MODULATOR 1-like isoform X1 [Actinidia eriantha]XP_057472993.1 protein METABOLIC NETWORK MODULATOR 1-like isoform X1 [Actinidia eriantha]